MRHFLFDHRTEDTRYGVVIMGKQAVDDDSNQVGQMLAALLRWPHLTRAAGVRIRARRDNLAVRTRYSYLVND